MSNQNTSQNGVTDRQERLLVELVRTSDIQAASKAAGVGRTTAYRWLREPGFAEELTRQRSEVMNDALASVKGLTGRAARKLEDLLDTDDERLCRQVCKDILSHAIKVRELEEIETRLARLEHQMKGASS